MFTLHNLSGPANSNSVRIFELALGYLGVAHFTFGLYLTVLEARIVPEYWLYYIIFCLPYLGITLVFLAAVVLAHNRRLRLASLLLTLGLVLSVCMCAYDFSHHRYHLSGGGTGATYTIWWWYYEPYWYGYKPGNI